MKSFTITACLLASQIAQASTESMPSPVSDNLGLIALFVIGLAGLLIARRRSNT